MKTSRYPFYFVLPALLLYAAFFIVPSIAGIGYAFTDWSPYSEQVNFIGWDNFAKIFSPSERYLVYIKNTLIFTAGTVVLKTIFALGLALLLNESVKRLVNFYRVMIYLPAVLPTLIVALIFRLTLCTLTGILNRLPARRRPRRVCAEMAHGPSHCPLLRHGGRYVEGRRLHHGDPAGRTADHPPRLL